MAPNDIIITVASWEERFWLGFKRIAEQSTPSTVVMYYYKEYASVTKAHRDCVAAFCNNRGIKVLGAELCFQDPVASWRALYDSVSSLEACGKNVMVDITTMPREAIWTVLDIIQDQGAIVQYAYHKPAAYNQEWLSRDPGRPRLIFKLAGVARLGAPAVLLVLTGYDPDRVRQLMVFFEPKVTLLGIQTGEQFENQTLNADRHLREFKNEPGITCFDVDAYCDDRGLSAIETQVKAYVQDTNLIMSSLGPKLSAIALHYSHRLHPESSLAYAPSNEFNPEYSAGIGETVVGVLTPWP